MPKKNLSAFLRKEVHRNKLKGVPPPKNSDSTFENLSAFEKLNPAAKFNAEMALLFPEPPPKEKKRRGRHDSNNVVDGDSAKDGGMSPQEERLKKFLEENKKDKKIGQEKQETEIITEKHKGLGLLKKELEALVSNEETLAVKDRRRMKGEKRKLLAEIAKLEVEVARIDTERVKAESYSELPPPISPMEIKRLARTAQRINKARAGKETHPYKPKRNYDDSDIEDMDGEERLRLGKKLKLLPTEQPEIYKKKIRVGSTVREEIVVSYTMEKLLEDRKARIEAERKQAVAETERIMREVAGIDEE